MTIDAVIPSVVSALLGGAVTGLGSYVAVRVSVAEMRRDQVALTGRVSVLEKHVGLDGSDRAAFVRRGECPLLEAGFRPELAEMRGAIARLSDRVSEIGAEVHQLTRDHIEIKKQVNQ